MRRNLVAMSVLMVLLSVLVAWYFIYEGKVRPSQDKAKEDSKRLVTLKADDVTLITLHRKEKSSEKKEGEKPKYKTVRIKKVGDDWHILEPVDDLADNSAIRALLNSATTTKEERIISEEAENLETYGLKDPRITVALSKNESEAPESIFVGNDTPVGYSVYAQSSNTPSVLRVSRSLHHALKKTVFTLRNKRIFPKMSSSNILEFEIGRGRGAFSLKRLDADWTLTRENLKADKKKTEKTLSTIVELKAKAFASENDEALIKYGLSNPFTKIVLTPKDKKTSRVELSIGKRGGNYYAKRADKPIIYEIEEKSLKDIRQPAGEYRNMNLASFNRFKIKRVKLVRGQNTIELLKEDKGTWTLPAEPSTKIDSDKVEDLLAKLQDIKISEYITGSKPKGQAGLTNPKLVLRLFEKSKDKEVEKISLSFGSTQNSKVYGAREGLQPLFQIKKSDYQKIDLKKQAFIKKEKPKEEKKSK